MTNVASTILEQLGGHHFVMMTGAKNFVGGDSELQFTVPRAENSINHVCIRLTGRDDYNVAFYSVRRRGLKVRVVAKYDGIYCDQLSSLFTTATGLRTSLGTMGRQQ